MITNTPTTIPPPTTTTIAPPTVTPIAPPIIPLWRQKFPSIASGVLSSVQFLITIVIIGCEVGSMLIDIVTGTVYVGLWASLFFMTSCVSQWIASCCCRARGCATYTLISQLISMVFALCVIGFDAYYIVSPHTCFFPSSVCNSSGSTRGLFYSDYNFNYIKIPLIKAQLAAGVLMFLLCIAYVIIYIVTSARVHRAKYPKLVYPQMQNQLMTPGALPNTLFPTQPASTYPTQFPHYPQPITSYPSALPGYPFPTTVYPPSALLVNGENRATELACPTCKTMMNMTATKRLPS
ncbi:unnamed protein product [Adineta ricciae]|uniref:Uncharacterized protein n=1 Tax=Adineta ricciae TaxID=249248 RepID=A0A815G6C6_ADIRI|nr:unnamed protein product [Adineta ricciae]